MTSEEGGLDWFQQQQHLWVKQVQAQERLTNQFVLACNQPAKTCDSELEIGDIFMSEWSGGGMIMRIGPILSTPVPSQYEARQIAFFTADGHAVAEWIVGARHATQGEKNTLCKKHYSRYAELLSVLGFPKESDKE